VVLTLIRDDGPVLTIDQRPVRHFGRSAGKAAMLRPGLMSGWKSAGVLAVLCSGVAWASLPRPADLPADEQREWHALAIAPLSNGGATGLRMEATAAVEPIEFAPTRPVPFAIAEKPVVAPMDTGPIRIRGRVGDGLYWSLRAAGASPQVAAQYLAALATELDVGADVSPGDSFDMVLQKAGGALLYAGLDRGAASSDLQLVQWNANGRAQWVDAANAERPAPVQSGLMMPAVGPITSYFGNRYHPILHFTRFHAGVDIGAGWGSPIVAAGDGRVVGAGWAGGYGREVQIAHGAGIISLYGHMSQIVAQQGSFVRQGQLIGYVGSSGLSTGPHLHFEIRQSGTPVNPLSVRFTSAPVVDTQLAGAVKARLKALLSVGVKRG
jgi:murein DD-endopeptidase MepM/ murein hydrolase activator NlpD